jgi:hypothetical protein
MPASPAGSAGAALAGSPADAAKERESAHVKAARRSMVTVPGAIVGEDARPKTNYRPTIFHCGRADNGQYDRRAIK